MYTSEPNEIAWTKARWAATIFASILAVVGVISLIVGTNIYLKGLPAAKDGLNLGMVLVVIAAIGANLAWIKCRALPRYARLAIGMIGILIGVPGIAGIFIALSMFGQNIATGATVAIYSVIAIIIGAVTGLAPFIFELRKLPQI